MLSHKEQIGRLDRRITFQQKVVGENVSNEDAEEGWEDITTNPTVWASRNDRAGREAYAADKLTGFQGFDFVCRFRSDVTIEMRITCEGKAHNIISIQEIGRRRFMGIITETGIDYVESESVGEFSQTEFSDEFRT